MLRLGHRHAHEEEPACDSPPNSTTFMVASPCTPAPCPSASCTGRARAWGTALCQRAQLPCSRPAPPTGRIGSAVSNIAPLGTGGPIGGPAQAFRWSSDTRGLCKPSRAARPTLPGLTRRQSPACSAVACSPQPPSSPPSCGQPAPCGAAAGLSHANGPSCACSSSIPTASTIYPSWGRRWPLRRTGLASRNDCPLPPGNRAVR